MWCILLLGCVPLAGQSLILQVDNLEFPESGGVVHFSALELGTEPISRADPIGQSDHFRLYLGTRGAYFDPDSRLFKYDLVCSVWATTAIPSSLK
jgi:hypothetical protein